MLGTSVQVGTCRAARLAPSAIGSPSYPLGKGDHNGAYLPPMSSAAINRVILLTC